MNWLLMRDNIAYVSVICWHNFYIDRYQLFSSI